MPKCPYCQSQVKPDPKNPGKYLCYTCKKRFPESVLLPDDDAPQATSPVTQPQANQVPAQMEPHPQGQFPQARKQEPGSQFQQAQQPQWNQPQPQQGGQQDFGSQFQQVQQPQWNQQQPQQEWQQDYGNQFQQAQQPQWDQQQPQQEWQQDYGSQFQQAQQPQWNQQQPQQFQPLQQPEFSGGMPQFPQQNPEAGIHDMQGMATAEVVANGGFNGILAHLFVMPDQMKLQQIAMQNGDHLRWYKAVVYVLAFLSVIVHCLGAVGSLFTMFSYGGLLYGLVNLIAHAIPIPLYLVARKRAALFTKDSWAELIFVNLLDVCLAACAHVLSVLFGGSVVATGAISTALATVISLVMVTIIASIFLILCWKYFSKRAAYFDYENPAIGCKPSSAAQMMSKVFGGFTGVSSNQPPAPQRQQQWQGDYVQGEQPAQQQFQQQWEANQQQWNMPQQWNG